MARPRKYKSAKAFREEVEAYFDAIRYVEPVTRREKTGEKDEYGHDRYEEKPVIAANGEQAVREVWTEPPSIAALCRSLGICRDTWAEYAKDERFSDTVTRARGVVEAYLVSRLEGKGARGVIFNLQTNFGWSAKQEIGLDEQTRKSLEKASLPMTEKVGLLMEMGLRLKDGEDDGHGGGETERG